MSQVAKRYIPGEIENALQRLLSQHHLLRRAITADHPRLRKAVQHLEMVQDDGPESQQLVYKPSTNGNGGAH